MEINMKIANKNVKVFFIFILDAIGVSFSYAIALLIRYPRFGIPERMQETYLVVYLCLLFATVLFSLILNQSRNYLHRGYYVELGLVTKNNLGLVIFIGLILFVIKGSENFSRLVFGYFAVCNEIIMFLLRIVVKKFLTMHFHSEKTRVKMVIITEKQCSELLVEELKKAKGFNYEYVGIVLWENSGVQQIGQIPIIADHTNFFEVTQNMPLDEVFIDLPSASDKQIRDIIIAMELMGVTCHHKFRPLEQEFYPQNYDTIGECHVMTYSIQNIPYEKLLVKRLLDIIGGVIGLLFTMILMPFVASAIKLNSPGPIFFKQDRIGKNGRKFTIYKFRSMCVDAEQKKKELQKNNEIQGLMFKMGNDPRITKVGRILRKTSIDELPQFYNVLKGDMSLVGTRPPTVDEFEKYSAYYKRRLCMTPGLTGRWQVSGRSEITNFDEVVKLDLSYIDNWSLGLDIKIIFQTILVVLFHCGAK